MRPDLFEQHTVHFHGYPNASSFYDGVPDASVAINIGGSFTYYYLAPDAGTYFWHCHITPPEHLQMGMVGQLYVRPRQNRYSGNLNTGLVLQQTDLRTACSSAADILCSNPGACHQYRRDKQRHEEVRLQRWRRLDLLRRRLPDPDARLRPELPLRRHDLQPGKVRRHEGQVLHAQRPQLSGHGNRRIRQSLHSGLGRRLVSVAGACRECSQPGCGGRAAQQHRPGAVHRAGRAVGAG
jgi:Multicopper oxidase